MIFILSSFCVVIFNFIVAKKSWFYKISERTNLFSENKFCFRFFPRKVPCLNSFSAKHRMSQQFFYDRYHLTAIFLWQVSSFFYEKYHIIELFNKDKYYKKDCVRFFLVRWSSFFIGLINSYYISKLSIIE